MNSSPIITVKLNKPIDEEIFEGCLRREVKAQKAFYQHFSSTMYAVCLRYSNAKEDAKDILQDGFVKVFSKLDQYTGKGSLEGWMKRIFINTALEHYRVNKVYQQQSDVDEAYSISVKSVALEQITQKEILHLLNQMAPGYRTVLNMYVIEGYNHAEIAEILGISEGTSKSQLSRARAIFIQTWEQLQKEKK
jgi:RNA polymerase sigma factor (sigma-70 family)